MATEITNTTETTSLSDLASYSFGSQAIGTAAADRLVVVGVTSKGLTGTPSISSATIGGISATILVQNTQGVTVSGLIAAAVPTGTTATIVITFSDTMDNCAITVFRLVGADIVPFETITWETESSGGDINCEADGSVVAVSNNSATTDATQTWTGLTEQSDLFCSEADFGDHNHSAASADFASAQTPLNIVCNWSSGTSHVNCAAAFSMPAVAGQPLYKRLGGVQWMGHGKQQDMGRRQW